MSRVASRIDVEGAVTVRDYAEMISAACEEMASDLKTAA
jgi:hypothetical protein